MLNKREYKGTAWDYVLILGQGRSGTSWLLDLLDLSRNTYCRNETNAIKTSPLAHLPLPAVTQLLDDSFGKKWDRAIAQSFLMMGERDRLGAHPKFYLYNPMRWLGFAALLNKRRLRQLLSLVMPKFSKPEWPLPWWLVNKSALKKALPVFKLNQVPVWGEWILLNRPQVLVIHIVRHPGGFLNSWQNRYLSSRAKDVVKIANKTRLKQVASHDAQWASRFGNIESMPVEESELWYWCYANEIIYLAGLSSPNYFRIIYEELATDTLNVMKHVYKVCRLPWRKEIEAGVSIKALNSKAISTTWQKMITKKNIALVKRALSGSRMNQWWDGIIS
jgi:hypothetical protein